MDNNMNDYISIRLKLSALRLKQMREDKELTLRDVGKILKCSPSTVMHYEQGTRVPTLEYLTAVAKTFNVSFEWITGGDDDIEKEKLLSAYDEYSDVEKRELLQFAQYIKERRRLTNGS